MAPSQPQDLLQRGLPLGDRARHLGGGLAVDLALQPQERRGIPEGHLGLAVQDALVRAPQDKARQVGGARRGQPSRRSRWSAGDAYAYPRRAAGAGLDAEQTEAARKFLADTLSYLPGVQQQTRPWDCRLPMPTMLSRAKSTTK
jgi:hypothetical protein